MAEHLDDSQSLESTTVGIYRTAAVVKGGRRFSFGALVVVGDRRGKVGIGYGKAPGVPGAIEKAQKDAKKNMLKVSMKEGTVPHPVTGLFSSSKVRLLPAAPGTGVIAGGTVRAVLEMAGVRDCLTKAYGSTNQKNLCKAVLEGLKSLRSKEEIEQLRGVTIGTTVVEEKIALGERFAPKRTAAAPAKPLKAKPEGGKRGKGKGKGKGKKAEEAAAESGEGAAATAVAEPPADSAPEAATPETSPAPESAPTTEAPEASDSGGDAEKAGE